MTMSLRVRHSMYVPRHPGPRGCVMGVLSCVPRMAPRSYRKYRVCPSSLAPLRVRRRGDLNTLRVTQRNIAYQRFQRV
jgi:hypothetical protein